MKHILYAIRDQGAGYYTTPIMVNRNDITPLREFQALATNPESIVNKHAAEFELHAIGEIDLETGEIFPLAKARTIASALDFQQKTT